MINCSGDSLRFATFEATSESLRSLRDDLPVRLAVAGTAAVVVGFCGIDAPYVLAESSSPWKLTIAAVCFIGALATQLCHSFPQLVLLSPGTRYWTLGLQALLTLATLPIFGQALLGLVPLLAGSVLLTLPRRFAWPAFAVVVACSQTAIYLLGIEWNVVYLTIEFFLNALVIFALSRLTELVAEVHHSRAELTRLAVTTERLRFSGDLHDLLGYSLSTIAVKCELADRLVSVSVTRAKQELREILDTARQALVDVRTVARGYRQMSLADEARDAYTMLASTGIHVTLDLDPAPLDPGADTVLATVLREALTNTLRHSKAEHCAITTTRTDEHIELSITNDGALTPPRSDHNGSGIRSLTTRVTRLGGTLDTLYHDSCFHITSRIPVEAAPRRSEAPRTADGRRESARHRPTLAPRTATLLTLGAFLGYLLQGVSFMYTYRLALPYLLSGTLFIVVALGLQLRQTFPRIIRRFPLRHRYLTLALQTAVAFVPYVYLKDTWLGTSGLVAGTGLLVLPRRGRWLVFSAATAGTILLRIHLGETTAVPIVYTGLMTPMTGLVVFGLSRLKDVIAEVHQSRAELSRHAVTAERLRFSGVLHDLLDYSLSAIAVRCERADRLLPGDVAAARQEVAEVFNTARNALTDVRNVARNYRPPSS